VSKNYEIERTIVQLENEIYQIKQQHGEANKENIRQDFWGRGQQGSEVSSTRLGTDFLKATVGDSVFRDCGLCKLLYCFCVCLSKIKIVNMLLFL